MARPGLLPLALLGPLLVSPVVAQTPADKAAATRLFDEGVAALRGGKAVEACPKLKESQHLDPALGTLLYLSECYALQGQTASAWVGFREAVDLAQRLQDKRLKGAKARAEELEPHLSKLVIEVPKESRVAGLLIERDGQRVEEVSWGTSVPVDPGEYRVTARAPGYQEQVDLVQVGPDGAQVTLKIKRPRKLASSSPTPVASTSVPGPDAQGGSAPATSPWRTAGYVAGGLGLVGLLGGGWLLRSASQMGDDSRAQRDLGLYHDAKDRQTWARVTLGAGAVLAAAGVGLVVLAPSPTSVSLRVQPLMTAQGPELGLTGDW